MLARIHDAVVEDLGFARAIVCSLTDGVVTPMVWDKVDDPAPVGPLVLSHDMPEAELARRREAVLVAESSSLLRGGDDWIGVPLIAGRTTIGIIIADRFPSIADDRDRDFLGVFGEAVSCAIERVTLAEQAKANMRTARAIAARFEAVFDDDPPVVLDRSSSAPDPVRYEDTGDGAGDHRLIGLLTPRELEVMELVAGGARNAQIAARLVISEGTVKSHIKKILRKLRASNRAEAVSKYLRIARRPVMPGST